MKDNIFSNFYSKVVSFFTSGKDDDDSARNTASSRLKLVLMQDRSNLDGATMQKMREQLITVISKYIEIDTEALDLNLEGDGEEIALMLNIPVIRARTPEEIAEIEAQEEAEKAKTESEEDDEEESEEKSESEADEENEGESEKSKESGDSESEEKTEDSEEVEVKEENETKEDKKSSTKSKK